MRRIGTGPACAGALLLCLGVATGCVTKGKYNSVMEERDQLQEENAKLQAERDAAVEQREELIAVAEEQQDELSAWEDDYNLLAEMFREEVASEQFRLKMLVDGVRVEIPSDVLYESGSARATVGSEGMEYAKELAEFLAETEYFISVVGHTDSQPPSAHLAETYPTNWDLAAARASNAVKYLVAHGVEPSRIVAVSRGDTDPVASNETPEGRAMNRRIEVVLRELPED